MKLHGTTNHVLSFQQHLVRCPWVERRGDNHIAKRSDAIARVQESGSTVLEKGRGNLQVDAATACAAHVHRARPLIRAANPLSVGAHLVLGDNGQRRRQRILKRLWVGKRLVDFRVGPASR